MQAAKLRVAFAILVGCGWQLLTNCGCKIPCLTVKHNLRATAQKPGFFEHLRFR
jgi:hypothetical protein